MFTNTLSILSLLATLSSTALAKYDCYEAPSNSYPYCVNAPDNASGDLPGIMFLSGSGARGPASQVKQLSGYDGFGKLINQYNSGNKGEAQTMAATKFVTIIPISPKTLSSGGEARHWWPEKINAVIADVKTKGYNVDWSSLHLTGYSMGGRGSWRNAVANPGTYASVAPCAGAAEKAGDGTLSQEKAPSVFDKLSAIKNMPVLQAAGTSDTTAGGAPPKNTQAELEKVGDSQAQLKYFNTDHNGMGLQPFNVELMQWMLKQSGGGTGSSSSDSDASSSDVEDNESTSSASSKSTKTKSSNSSKATKTSSAGSSEYTETPSNIKLGVSDDSTEEDDTTTSTKKCSSSASRRRRRARRSMGQEGYAHPGPVRRGVFDSPSPIAKRSAPVVKRGLSLAAIVAHQENSKSASSTVEKRDVQQSKPEIVLRRTTPQESLKAHAATAQNNGRRSHISNNKLGRRLASH